MKTGAKISGNTVFPGNGGGVLADATFRIVTGTVYGENESPLSNTAPNGAALHVSAGETGGTAECGTFSVPGNIASEWTGANLPSADSTIDVADGALQ